MGVYASAVEVNLDKKVLLQSTQRNYLVKTPPFDQRLKQNKAK